MSRSGAFTELGKLPAGAESAAALSPDGRAAAISDSASRVLLFDMARRVGLRYA